LEAVNASPAGFGTCRSSTYVPGPQGLAFDRDGNLYVGSFSKIQKVDRNGQVIASWSNGQRALPVDGIPAATAPLNNVGGLAIDAAGNIVYSDDQSVSRAPHQHRHRPARNSRRDCAGALCAISVTAAAKR
jgi:DNA-binding beta-propeller fold protein YncE